MLGGVGPETANMQAASTDPAPQPALPPLVLVYVVEERNDVVGLAAASGVALVVMFHVRIAPVTESVVKYPVAVPPSVNVMGFGGSFGVKPVNVQTIVPALAVNELRIISPAPTNAIIFAFIDVPLIDFLSVNRRRTSVAPILVFVAGCSVRG